jgi:hypothetical protein
MQQNSLPSQGAFPSLFLGPSPSFSKFHTCQMARAGPKFIFFATITNHGSSEPGLRPHLRHFPLLNDRHLFAAQKAIRCALRCLMSISQSFQTIGHEFRNDKQSSHFITKNPDFGLMRSELHTCPATTHQDHIHFTQTYEKFKQSVDGKKSLSQCPSSRSRLS